MLEMNPHCFCCGVEVKIENCPATGHKRVGTLELVWDGWVVRRIEIWRHPDDDTVWFAATLDGRSPICGNCVTRAIGVELPALAAEAA